MPEALKKSRKKKEFVHETAKKYWKMKATDFVREKRTRVLDNNRGSKKQEIRRANCAGMGTPPPATRNAGGREGNISDHATVVWLEHEIRCIDLRTQAVLMTLTLGVQEMDSVMADEYALMKGDDVTMIRMQKGMKVSKAGTEALTAAVAAVPFVNTEEPWKNKMRDASIEHRDHQ
jgi:hypothetical protein